MIGKFALLSKKSEPLWRNELNVLASSKGQVLNFLATGVSLSKLKEKSNLT
jgi:hypothetical protein